MNKDHTFAELLVVDDRPGNLLVLKAIMDAVVIVARSRALVPVEAHLPDSCLVMAAVPARQTRRWRGVLAHAPFHPEVYTCGPPGHFSCQLKS
jgi:hypothetical protein